MSKIVRQFTFPATNATVRRELVKQDRCPECGGELDTGWECNRCGFDARPEVHWSPVDQMDRKP